VATSTKTQPDETEVKPSEPRFDFDELAPDHETIKVGGKLYEIKRLDDFGIEDQQALDRDGREFARLWTSDTELTANQKPRLKFLLERIFGQLLPDVPKAQRAKIRDAAKAELVLDFSLAPLRKALAAQMEAQLQQQKTNDEQAEESTSES
jgi:hypothetical protein